MKQLVRCWLAVVLFSCSYIESFQVGSSQLDGTHRTAGSLPLLATASGTTFDAATETKRSNARSVAIQSLVRATTAKPSLTQMERNPAFGQLSVRDKAFCRLVVTTVERQKGQIDAILEHCKKKKTTDNLKKPRAIDQLVHATLQVGVVQILYLNTTGFAAVKETVDTLKHSKLASEKQVGYVNAILRRITRELDQFSTGAFADLQLNAAPWLVEEMNRDWGEQATQNMLEHAMTETPRTLTVRGQSKKDAENVASLFNHTVVLPQGSIRVVKPPPGPVSGWPLYSEGHWWCQDPSATLPALALQSSSQLAAHEQSPRALDMCAAPGGKTAQLLDMGFCVTALDVSEKRVHTLRQNLARLQFNDLEVVVANATTWTPNAPFDYVLLDAPCSATGTASKRPDVLWKSSHVVDELLNTQYALLEHAVDCLLQPNGILVYATCSLLKRESEDQVSKLLEKRSAEVELVPFQVGEIDGLTQWQISEEGHIRVLPSPLLDWESPEFNGDGFFVARLRKLNK